MCRQGQAKALMVIWLAELTDHSCYNWWTRSQMPQEINTAYSESAACREREGGRERERERERLHLFQPPRADQMPDPHQGQCYNIHPDIL